MNKVATSLLILLTFVVHMQAAELSFSGDATLTSTYVWRGVTQFNGAAMQGTGEISYGILSMGYWISTMQGDYDYAVETDPYIGVSLPTGPVETSIGGTIYSYDFFEHAGATVYEMFVSAGYGPLGLSFFYTPTQEEPGIDDALYWTELSAGVAVLGADVSATLSFGNYSAVSKQDAATNLLLSAGKSVTEAISVSWNWNIALSEGPNNAFFMIASYGF
ncbi:hypothetical protein EH223_03390 [candidate division KSB1 bacterium]|nr:hypothetical protein [candidate division KSB1 bacterium]RQW06019.1 MAG: hypothetical protein EH223_03390 [candidate division KSB1 bacterium]